MRPLPRRTTPVRTALRTGLAVTLAGGVLATLPAAPAAANRVTPGNFTGYGFDQCLAPESWKMDRWMEQSPFSAVGIYISGASRGCRDQPNLTPAWVSHQLENGWRLLPITLGPQASCHPAFPRYGNDPTIRTNSADNYRAARKQARAEADTAVAAAQRLGITEGSTLWYDLEGANGLLTNATCRESALSFLSAWTSRLHRNGYVSGVYSSAGSGIKILDDVRVNRPNAYQLPDRVWIARWDGKANLDACRDQPTCYVRTDGWKPHRRVKQYRGGHNETWGGVTINIDSNFMSLGKGSVAPRSNGVQCGDVPVNRPDYPTIKPGTTRAEAVRLMQCQLRKRKLYDGALHGRFDAATLTAVQAYQRSQPDTPVKGRWTRRNWAQALSTGPNDVAKRGTARGYVLRLQRALIAMTGEKMYIDGVFGQRTENIVRLWQGRVDLRQTGVMNEASWKALRTGRRT
jgi:hypothetical protein